MKTTWWLVVAVATVLLAGGLFASNMAFKLVYRMEAQGTPVPGGGTSRSGLQSIALPYYQQTNLSNALDLINDMGGTGIISSVQVWVRTINAFGQYSGALGTPFPLNSGEGYLVQLRPDAPATVDYVVVGSHNPGLGINLITQATGVSATGINFWAAPYALVNNRADMLMNEIDEFMGAKLATCSVTEPPSCAVTQMMQVIQSSDSFFVAYTGLAGTPFPLVPGESYFIQVRHNVAGWVPLVY